MNKNSGKRHSLFESQLGRCAYCGEELRFLKKGDKDFGNGYLKPTLDHILPKSKGGLNGIDNLVLVHGKCNIVKGDLMPDEIVKLLENMKITFESRGLLTH